MSLLLDTNVLLRLVIDSSDISETFQEEVESGLAGGSIAVSTVTFVEITRLHRHGRIDLGCHPAVWRRERLRSGLLEIPVRWRSRRRVGIAHELPVSIATLLTNYSSPRPCWQGCALPQRMKRSSAGHNEAVCFPWWTRPPRP